MQNLCRWFYETTNPCLCKPVDFYDELGLAPLLCSREQHLGFPRCIMYVCVCALTYGGIHVYQCIYRPIVWGSTLPFFRATLHRMSCSSLYQGMAYLEKQSDLAPAVATPTKVKAVG